MFSVSELIEDRPPPLTKFTTCFHTYITNMLVSLLIVAWRDGTVNGVWCRTAGDSGVSTF